MQILTRYGHFSVECAQRGITVDTGTLVVRARTREEMATLQAIYPRLGFFSVTQAPDDEHAVEIQLPKPMWSRVVEDLVLDLNYAGPVPGQTSAIVFTLPPRRARHGSRITETTDSTPLSLVEQKQLSLWAA